MKNAALAVAAFTLGALASGATLAAVRGCLLRGAGTLSLDRLLGLR